MFRIFIVIAMMCVNLNANVTIYKIKGKVEFIDINNKILSLKEGDNIDENITVKTYPSSEVELVYDDGIMVFLSENSSFTIRKVQKIKQASWILDILTLNLYADEKGNESWFDYLYGKAMFFVKKLDKSYNVKTPTAVCGVRGTNFSIVADENISEVGLFKGIVEVEKDDKRLILKPGQLAIITRQDIKVENRLSSIMDKEKKRAEKLEKYFENVMIRLKKRDETVRKKIEDLNKKMKQ